VEYSFDLERWEGGEVWGKVNAASQRNQRGGQWSMNRDSSGKEMLRYLIVEVSCRAWAEGGGYNDHLHSKRSSFLQFEQASRAGNWGRRRGGRGIKNVKGRKKKGTKGVRGWGRGDSVQSRVLGVVEFQRIGGEIGRRFSLEWEAAKRLEREKLSGKKKN